MSLYLKSRPQNKTSKMALFLSLSFFLSLSLSLDLLSDILSFVLSKKFQQHVKEEQEVTERQRRVSQQAMTQEVLRNCFTLLHALAYKNELVRNTLATLYVTSPYVLAAASVFKPSKRAQPLLCKLCAR